MRVRSVRIATVVSFFMFFEFWLAFPAFDLMLQELSIFRQPNPRDIRHGPVAEEEEEKGKTGVANKRLAPVPSLARLPDLSRAQVASEQSPILRSNILVD